VCDASQGEWEKDAGGCDSMTYPQFFRAVFELCGTAILVCLRFGFFHRLLNAVPDQWTPSLEVDEYVKLLTTLLAPVQAEFAMKWGSMQPLDSSERMSDAAPRTPAVGTSSTIIINPASSGMSPNVVVSAVEQEFIVPADSQPLVSDLKRTPKSRQATASKHGSPANGLNQGSGVLPWQAGAVSTTSPQHCDLEGVAGSPRLLKGLPPHTCGKSPQTVHQMTAESDGVISGCGPVEIGTECVACDRVAAFNKRRRWILDGHEAAAARNRGNSFHSRVSSGSLELDANSRNSIVIPSPSREKLGSFGDGDLSAEDFVPGGADVSLLSPLPQLSPFWFEDFAPDVDKVCCGCVADPHSMPGIMVAVCRGSLK
jgi:hypothetical protein